MKPSLDGVQHTLLARGREFEYHAEARSAAPIGSAVSETVLYTFTGGSDGGFSNAGVTRDLVHRLGLIFPFE